MAVRIETLSARSDPRGDSWTLALPFDVVRESHVATVRPGHVRGNHVHAAGRELLVVLYEDAWSLYWDEGEGMPVQQSRFEGCGLIQVGIKPGSAHAIRNDGSRDLTIFVLGDSPRSPVQPDTTVRRLV
jgi:oxalate decarboxylase/phosphoglucose isomerase-like protein (cupin superfamily)